jgi:hypothetical protein
MQVLICVVAREGDNVHSPIPQEHLDTVGTTWRYSDGDLHAAYDYRVGLGTPLFAVRDGVVLACNDGVKNNAAGADPIPNSPSNWVLLGIKYKGRPASVYYQHLSPGLNVKKGDKVKEGQRLGRSGNTGNSTGPHLHLAAMWGHRDSDSRYDYMDSIGGSEAPPSSGTASNEICIFPPSQIFLRNGGRSPWASGPVFVDKLRFGMMDSDSVRRLQHRLNGISLVGGAEIPVTGNYLDQTKSEVRKWQIQKVGAKPGSPEAGGEQLTVSQARRIFGKRYVVKT